MYVLHNGSLEASRFWAIFLPSPANAAMLISRKMASMATGNQIFLKMTSLASRLLHSSRCKPADQRRIAGQAVATQNTKKSNRG